MLEPKGGIERKRAWGETRGRPKRDKEKANKVAQQVRGAAALTAELAAQSEKKTAAVCDQPLEHGELAGHIEASNMVRQVAPHTQATDAGPMGHKQILAKKGTFALTKGFREARSGQSHETWRREAWLTKLWTST